MFEWKDKNVLVMTSTTHYWLGKVVDINMLSIDMVQVSWVADLGRHSEFIATGKPDSNTEIEVHPPELVATLPRAGTTIIEWPHKLPTKTV